LTDVTSVTRPSYAVRSSRTDGNTGSGTARTTSSADAVASAALPATSKPADRAAFRVAGSAS
jgi:hypothetical protein